ncbi:hypothetical protein AHF37_05502 [Paragonimus kellicotti]|nr:hypothetical protein AHF37_05502 [Paragonimus kellicotti]
MSEHEEGARGPCWKGIALILGTAGLSALSGFAATVLMARKLEPTEFMKGFQPTVVERSGKFIRHEPGVRLAARALCWATVFTVGALGGGVFIVWRLSGAKTMQELNSRFASAFPSSWRLKSSDKSTDFQTFDELLTYILSQESNPPK